MDKATLYERLVALCEQYDPQARNSHETLFALMDIEREIGTVEANLIVSAFMDRTRLRRAHDYLYEAFVKAHKEVAEAQKADSDRRLTNALRTHLQAKDTKGPLNG